MVDAAQRFLRAGCSVIPVGDDKRSTVKWAKFQSERMALDDVERLFGSAWGVAVLCGDISGALEVLDFDAKHYPKDRDFYEEWLSRLDEASPGLAARLTLLVETPSGGWHVPYRCLDGVGKNAKLAMALVHEDLPPQEVIETRGNGGYVVAWPSPGYVVRKGSWGQIPTLSGEDRDVLLSVARSLSETVERPYTAPGPQELRRPGDDFNRSHSWHDVLEPYGWTFAYERGGEGYWTRPGKSRKDGTSATTNFKGSDVLKVFTSNAHPFEPGCTYSRFYAYSLLEFGGNMADAARHLGQKGYGDQQPPKQGERPKERERATVQPRPRQRWVTMNEIETKHVDWLWRPYIPLGEYTVVAGMPGVGKSTFVQQVATAVSTGGEIMGSEVCKGRVAFLSAEQGLRTVTKPRFEQMGADLSKIACPDEENEQGEIVPYTLDGQGVNELYTNIQGQGYKLLVVDTGDAYFEAEKSTNSQIDVRAWLNRLIAIARRENLAIVVLMHLNKAYGMDPLNRIAGSVAWGGAARSGLLCGHDPNDQSKCAVDHIKSNVGPKGRPIGYFIEDRGHDIGHFGWCETDLTAGQMCEAPQTTEAKQKSVDCQEWLLDFLKDGAVPGKEVEAAAKKEGYSRNTLFDAKKRAGVKSSKDGLIGGWSWHLKEEGGEPPYWAK